MLLVEALAPDKYLTERQARKVVRAARQRMEARPNSKLAERNYYIVVTLLNSGLRATELARLTLADVRVGRGERPALAVRGGKCRPADHVDWVLLDKDRVARALRRWVRHRCRELGRPLEAVGDRPLFCSSHGGHLTRRQVLRIFKRICKKAGVGGYDVHAARHTFGMRTYRGTKDLEHTRRQMRHRDVQSTLVYLHAVDDDEQVEKVKGLV